MDWTTYNEITAHDVVQTAECCTERKRWVVLVRQKALLLLSAQIGQRAGRTD
jgi:hypothetical protein